MRKGGSYMHALGLRSADCIARVIPFVTLLRAARVGPLVLYYHGVSDVGPQHTRCLYKMRSPEEFAKDLDFCLNHLRPLSIAEMLDAAAGAHVENGFFITFDDGLREVAEIAAPIMRERGIVGAVFVNPPLIHNHTLLYRHKAAILVEAVTSASESHLKIVATRLGMTSWSLPHVIGRILSVNFQEREVLDLVAFALGVSWEEYLLKRRPYMTKTQLLQLKSEGWLIGAHSMEHPRYSEIPEMDQFDQTAESVDAVDMLFTPDFRAFAFPYSHEGVSEKFFDDTRRELRIRLFFGTGGWWHRPDIMLVNRVSLEGDKPAAEDFLPRSLALNWLVRAKRSFTGAK